MTASRALCYTSQRSSLPMASRLKYEESIVLFFFDYPKVKHSLGQAALQDPYPALFLDSQVVVRAANLMAFWMLDTIKPGEPIRPDVLLGRSVFNIFAENFKRIPAEQNNEFYTKKSAVVKRLKNELGEDSPSHASFTTTMKAYLQLPQIYKQPTLYPDTACDFIFTLPSPATNQLPASPFLH